MSSTFGTFNTARLGIYAAQKGLDVTGNNITNINTPGYTRQRLEQTSLVTTATDKYFSQYKTRVGQGVLTTGVSQLRDPGLDLLYRETQTDLSSADAKLKGVQDLASILDEVGKGDGEQDDGVILSQLNDLRDLISQAVTNGIDGYDGLIQASASALCTHFNQYAKLLESLKGTYETYLEQDVSQVNALLTNIQRLNVSIRDADIRGDDALELRDERNRCLDELSQYMKIDVKYTTEDVGAGLVVEKLTVSLSNEPPHNHTLVDGEYAAQVGVDLNDPDYGVNLYALRDLDGKKKNDQDWDPMQLQDNDLYGSLQSLREMLTEKGEYATQGDVDKDSDALIKRGIPYYQNALDNLAREFAEQMNELNKGPDGTTVEGAGVLFSQGSNNNDTDHITAANISVSKAWGEHTVSMVATWNPDASSGDTSNLAAFLDVFSKKHAFNPGDIVAGALGEEAPYEGTFEDMLLRIESTLAEDQMATESVLNNYAITYDEVYTDRDSVSGVDLNDEATNLMVYQKAYSAACRLMTVLEEALDALMAM
ncbi:MAG: flagellar hook-associated protein FlgK [Lawsonibacter sp.]